MVWCIGNSLWLLGLSKSFVGVWGNVADSASVSSGKSDVSFLSPSGSPWVLNNPIVIVDSD